MTVEFAKGQRSDAEVIFDEQSARQLAEIVRAIARDRGVQAAAVTVSADEDRSGVRFVVCAPCAQSEADFGLAVGKAIAAELRADARDRVDTKLIRAVESFLGRGVIGSAGDTFTVERGSWAELGRAVSAARRGAR